jgi:hypothetical protein
MKGVEPEILFSNISFWVRRRVWRYQRGNQNPEIEEGQTTQWRKEKWRATIWVVLEADYEIKLLIITSGKKGE